MERNTVVISFDPLNSAHNIFLQIIRGWSGTYWDEVQIHPDGRTVEFVEQSLYHKAYLALSKEF